MIGDISFYRSLLKDAQKLVLINSLDLLNRLSQQKPNQVLILYKVLYLSLYCYSITTAAAAHAHNLLINTRGSNQKEDEDTNKCKMK